MPGGKTHSQGRGPRFHQGTRSHMLQLKVGTPQLKIPSAATKTQSREINKYEEKGMNAGRKAESVGKDR